MILESNMIMELGGKQQKIDAHTELEYTWQRKDLERALVIDSVLIKATSNGKDMMNSTMSRNKFTAVDGGKTTEIPFEQAPAELKALLRDSFGTPLFTMQVDAQGKEVSRKVTAGPGAKDLLDNGMIANGLLFHPSMPAGQAEWQSDTEMSMGNGGYAKGKLTYKKVEGRPGEVFSVTGTLTNDNFPRPGTPVVVKNARYVVNGEQTYDAAQKEWASGKLNLDIVFEMTANDKPLGTAKGKIEASMQTRGK
jgi:hypothetical protein